MAEDKPSSNQRGPYGLRYSDLALLCVLFLCLILGLFPVRWRALCNRGDTSPLCPQRATPFETRMAPQATPTQTSAAVPVAVALTATPSTTPSETPTISPTAVAATAVPATAPPATETPGRAPITTSLIFGPVEHTEKDDLITYTLSILNEGPADPITATLIHAFDSPDALASAEGTDCHPLDGGVLTCVVREVRIGSPIVQELLVTVSPDYSGTLTNTITLTGTQQAININPDNSRPIAIRLEPPPMFPAFARVAYVLSNRASHELGLVDSNGRLIDPSLHLYAAAPAWSPGGNEIAFFGEPGINQLGSLFNQGNGIWIINARGNSPSQLVAVDHVQNIAWSPDGTKLAFEVANPPEIANEIRVVDATGGIEISRFPGQQPAWRPDSQKLAVRNCTVSNGLCLLNFDGSGAQALTTQGKDSYPAWSPDGQYLAFTSERHNGWEIYLLRLADRQVERVTNRAGSDVTPVFGPNSRDVYLRTDAYGDWRITVWNLETERELTVRKDVGPSDDWGLARPAVH